ncbi:MAG: hypothetical protein GY847_16105 [Proteobacteria bacterium]|nr:hypothetical protein [Pseudomonadota bacterium]
MSNDTRILERFGEEVAETLGAGPPEVRCEAQKRSLLSTVTNKERPYRLKVLTAAMATAVLLATLGVFFSQDRQSPLPFWVGAQLETGNEGGWIETLPGQSSVPVRFEGGSKLELENETAARVIMSNRKNVRVDLTKGKIKAQIKGNGKTSWSVKAGPYQIAVMGTSFSVNWDTQTSKLDVSVTKGLVMVSGIGLSKHGISLAAGDHLRADGKEVLVALNSEQTADKSSASRVASKQEASDEVEVIAETEDPPKDIRQKAGQTSSIPRIKPKKLTESNSWKELFKKKQYAQAIYTAEQEGLDRLVNTLGLEDLWQLASAARYVRKGRISTDILIAIRERFGASRRAETATFLLGRVALELRHNPIDARKWFRNYLDKSPSGPLAEEALGRLIDACDRAGRGKEARQNADLYITRYPNSVFTELARSVLKK